MANGNGRKGLPRASGLVGGGYGNKSALKKRMKVILGMRKHPTTAGQAKFGDVDVTGAQTTAREQERMNEGLGQSARGLLGAQMTEAERRRMGGGR